MVQFQLIQYNNPVAIQKRERHNQNEAAHGEKHFHWNGYVAASRCGTLYNRPTNKRKFCAKMAVQTHCTDDVLFSDYYKYEI